MKNCVKTQPERKLLTSSLPFFKMAGIFLLFHFSTYQKNANQRANQKSRGYACA